MQRPDEVGTLHLYPRRSPARHFLGLETPRCIRRGLCWCSAAATSRSQTIREFGGAHITHQPWDVFSSQKVLQRLCSAANVRFFSSQTYFTLRLKPYAAHWGNRLQSILSATRWEGALVLQSLAYHVILQAMSSSQLLASQTTNLFFKSLPKL